MTDIFEIAQSYEDLCKERSVLPHPLIKALFNVDKDQFVV